MKSRDGKSQRREEKKKEDQKRESLRRQKIQAREKVGKSRNTVFLQWFVAPEGRNCRLAKAAGAEPAGQMRDEKLHTVVARSTFQSQKCKKLPGSEHFLKLRCRKTPRLAARSTCRSQNVQNTPGSAHFWKWEWDVEKCTPLWRAAHFEVKM